MDFEINGSGSIYTVVSKTPDARQWVEENVEIASYMGNSSMFYCEHNFVENLAEGMVYNGFSVEVNGEEFNG